MKTLGGFTYTAPCPNCPRDCTWTATLHETGSPATMPTSATTVDGGNCPCTTPAPDVAA